MVENKKFVTKVLIENDAAVDVAEVAELLKPSQVYNNNLSVEIDSSKFSEGSRKSKSQDGSKRKYTGLVLAITAGVFMTLSMVVVKMLTKRNYDPMNLSMMRYSGTTILGLPLTLYFQYWKKTSPFGTLWCKKKTSKENWTAIFWLFMSCVAGTSTFLLRYVSLQYLSIADSTVISYSGPIVVVFLAHFFLNEKCGVVSILIALWTFLGVFAISRPPILTGQAEYSSEALVGTGIALGGMACGSICIILLRYAREIQFSIVILASGVWGTLQSGLLAYTIGRVETPTELTDILLVLAMSGLSFFGGLCVTLAVKFEQAGPYALIRSSDILFSFLWQFLFLNVFPDLASIIGAVIVITGILITTFRKWISTLPEQNRTRHMFRFLLC